MSCFPFWFLMTMKKGKTSKNVNAGVEKLFFWTCSGACRGCPWSPFADLVWISPVMSTVMIHLKSIWQYMQVLPAKNNSSWQLHYCFFSVTLPFVSCHSSFPVLSCYSVHLICAMMCCETTCQAAAWTCSLPAQHSQGFPDLENFCVFNSLFHCYGQAAKDD